MHIFLQYQDVCISLVFSIYDSTEEAIKKMIEANKRMINEQHNNQVVNEHFKLQIKTLQSAPRDIDKIKRLLRLKEKEKDEAIYIQDTERLFTEIEMLRVELYLVNRNNNNNNKS